MVIAPFAFGYTSHIKKALDRFGVNAHIVYLDEPAFAYKNSLHRAYNFLSKLIGRNLKKTFVFDRIKIVLSTVPQQDIIFVIRPDMLNDATLKLIKKQTLHSIAYFYDSTRRFPRKVHIAKYFDEVYSYDKLDVETYHYKFLTNYIFSESSKSKADYQFFNISTVDYRFPLIEKLAAYIKDKDWSYKILGYSPDVLSSESVAILNKQKSIEEVSELIQKSKIIIEIQRSEQTGLSFRIFEALGHRKKLITTNADVVNYDFYHPQNILVIDPENIHIPENFVTSPYVEIDDAILAPYRIENWVNRVFELKD